MSARTRVANILRVLDMDDDVVLVRRETLERLEDTIKQLRWEK